MLLAYWVVRGKPSICVNFPYLPNRKMSQMRKVFYDELGLCFSMFDIILLLVVLMCLLALFYSFAF